MMSDEEFKKDFERGNGPPFRLLTDRITALSLPHPSTEIPRLRSGFSAAGSDAR